MGEDKNEQENKGVLHKVKGHAISSFATLALTIFMLRTDIMKIENAELKTAYTRISQLEANQTLINDRAVRQATEITQLKIKLDLKFQPSQYVGTFLEAIEYPAWVKVWDGKDFRMLIINTAYAKMYDISKHKYRGRTDFEVYDQATAELYRQNDMKTLNHKGFTESVETVFPVNGKPRTVRVWKFYLLLPDGRDAVGGMIID